MLLLYHSLRKNAISHTGTQEKYNDRTHTPVHGTQTTGRAAAYKAAGSPGTQNAPRELVKGSMKLPVDYPLFHRDASSPFTRLTIKQKLP